MRGQWQQHPRCRQVRRRIAGTEIPEVDHGRKTAVADEQIAGMKIAVNPQQWSGPRWRHHDALPDGEDGHAIDEAVELLEVFSQDVRASGEWHTSPRVVWRVSRCGLVERAKKLSQSDSRRLEVV